MHLEQILKNLPLGVGTPYKKTGLNIFSFPFQFSTPNSQMQSIYNPRFQSLSTGVHKSSACFI